MSDKPTYEELQHKVRALEKEVTQCKEVIEGFNQASEEKEAILDSLVELVIHQDLENTVLWANQAACESVGMKRQEMIGRKCYTIWGQQDDPCVDCPVNIARDTRKPHKAEKKTPDGRSWHIQGYPIRNDDNNDIVGMVELALETTKSKQTEEEKDKLESQLRTMIDSCPGWMACLDTDGNYLIATIITQKPSTSLCHRSRGTISRNSSLLTFTSGTSDSSLRVLP